MRRYLLCHRHEPAECSIAFAAWRGVDSPLRHHATIGSCATGGHALWWTIDASDADGALSLLPPWLADRTEISEVSEIPIP